MLSVLEVLLAQQPPPFYMVSVLEVLLAYQAPPFYCLWFKSFGKFLAALSFEKISFRSIAGHS